MVNKIVNTINKGFKVGFFHLLSASLLIQIAGFGGQIFLTRVLSVEDIGRIRVLQSFLTIALVVGSLGVNTGILKLCSERISEEQKVNLYNIGLRMSLFSALFIILIFYTLAELNLISKDNITNQLIFIYSLQLPFLIFNNLSIAYMHAQKKLKVVSNLQSLTKVFVLFTSIVFSIIMGLNGYILGLVASTIISTFFVIWLQRKELSQFFNNEVKGIIVRRLVNVSGYAFGSNVLKQVLLTANVILASYLISDNSEIAYYGIAQLILTTILIIPATLNQIMIPYISEKTGKRPVMKILNKYEKRMLILIFLIVISSYLILPTLIPLVFGNQYSNSIPYLNILLIGLIFRGLYSPKNNTLLSVGRTDLNFYSYLFTTIISIILSIILIQKFGMIGAAFAYVFSELIMFFINYFFFKRYLIDY